MQIRIYLRQAGHTEGNDHMRVLAAAALTFILYLTGSGQTRPKPTPTPDILKGGTVTDAADRIVTDSIGGGKGKYDGIFDGKPNTSGGKSAVKTPPAWKRTVLTGTGVSVASPVPFTLGRSEPIVSIDGKVEANVVWEFEHGGLRAYVEYKKTSEGYKAVRQNLEDFVAYMLNNAKAVESLIHDTTFLGETGAFYDEARYEPSAKKSIRRKVLVFGRPNDYVTIDHIFAADDTAAAELSSQIIASLKKEGTVAVGKSKFPPEEWKVYNFGGLLFESPARPSENICRTKLPDRVSQTCSVWGENMVNIQVLYSTYSPKITPRTAMQEAEEHVKTMKELEARSKSGSISNVRITPFPINIGDAARVVEDSGINIRQTIYIRRGNALWQVSISYSTVFGQTKIIGERSVGSVKFKN